MSFSLDNLVQPINTGSFDGSSGNATLPTGTTAGSLVLIFAGYGATGDGTTYDITTPSGFTLIGGQSGTTSDRKANTKIFAKKNVSASETSWTLAMSPTAGQVVWAVLELEGVGLDALNEWFVNSGTSLPAYNGSNPTSQTSGTTSQTSCLDVMALSLHVARSNNTTIPTWSSQTNGFTEAVEVSNVNATNAVSMVISTKSSYVLDTFECTASLSPGSPASGTVVVLYPDGVRHAPNFDIICGFEFGTATGMTNGVSATGSAPVDAITGSPSVVTTNPRTGSYCLELSSSAAAENISWTSSGALAVYLPTSDYPIIESFAFYCPTSLPSADTEIASVDAGSTGTLTFWYRSATSKIGAVVGSGTEILSDSAISVNKWIGFEFRYDPRVTNHLCDWQIDYDLSDATGPVAQTQAVGSGTSVQSITASRIGWHNARTATIRYDDIAIGKSWGMYPAYNVNIVSVPVDSSGTPTISGTTGNFKVFTNNGSMATWDASLARSYLAEIPPVVGSTATGIAQVTATIGEYADIPMSTFTAAPDYVLRALRWYVAGWAASGNPAETEFRSYDGVTEFSLIGSGDHGLDDTTLRWFTRMQRSSNDSSFYNLTQTKLDSMSLRMRSGADANPDVGWISCLGELAYQPAAVYGVLSIENDTFTVYVRQDRVFGNVASFLITTPPGSRGATFYHSISGTPQDSVYVNPNTAHEITIGAESLDEVTYISLAADQG